MTNELCDQHKKIKKKFMHIIISQLIKKSCDQHFFEKSELISTNNFFNVFDHSFVVETIYCSTTLAFQMCNFVEKYYSRVSNAQYLAIQQRTFFVTIQNKQRNYNFAFSVDFFSQNTIRKNRTAQHNQTFDDT